MSSWKYWALACLTAVAGFGFDQVTKVLFFHDPLPADHFVLIEGVVEQVSHKNFGITANLPVPLWAIVVVTLIAVGLIGWMMQKKAQEKHIWGMVFLGILLGGAIGNLVDRVWLGFVRDWLLLFGRSAVNGADAAIVIGFLGVMIGSSRKGKEEKA